MFRRSILEFSSRRAFRSNPRHFVNQKIPSQLSSRKKFSNASRPAGGSAPGSTGKPPESRASQSKFLIGSAAVSAALLAAYQFGFLDKYLEKEKLNFEEDQINGTVGDPKSEQHSIEELVSPSSEKSNNENPAVDHAEQNIDTRFSQPEVLVEDSGDKPIPKEEISDIAEDRNVGAKENQFPEYPESSLTSDDPIKESAVQSDGIVDIKKTEIDVSLRPEEEIQHTSTSTQVDAFVVENGTENIQPKQQDIEERSENVLGKDIEQPPTLLEEYHLRNKSEGNPRTYLNSHGFTENSNFPEDKEALSGAIEDLKGGYVTSKDGELVIGFVQAIHAAEKRQAAIDAHVFNEEKRALKEKYEKKLKDAAAKELMLAEESAMLDKELKREKAKAALAIKSLQEKMDEKLKTELEQKKIEAELKLKEVQELAQAELNAAIAKEKAAQLEKMSEANININALCMAFYARSEEARQSHAAQNFALKALALEDALSKGLPIQTEIESLQSYLEGADKDSVLDLVLASLPEETRNNGTDTQLKLKQKFDFLKGNIRHFVYFPPGGGGMLAHSLARAASLLKVREADQSGDGIESVINKVESYLAEGNLAEAAEFLEESVRDTQAAEIVAGWVKQARNRAISEQAVVFLQSYANSISLS